MTTSIGASHIARALNAWSYAGPHSSPIAAQGIVTRLKRAATWSNSRLERLSGLPEAAEVAVSPVLILDRHGLNARVARALDEISPIASSHHVGVSLRIMRALSTLATGLWDPKRGVRVLVAPNVLTNAHRYALDQGDWCKWVALACGLHGVLVVRAPFLVDVNLSPDELMRRLLLSESLVDALMGSIGPRELGSVEWLRHHGPQASPIDLLARMPREFHDPASLLENHRHLPRFSAHVLRSGRLETLLSSTEALPSLTELAHPESWVARVG